VSFRLSPGNVGGAEIARVDNAGVDKSARRSRDGHLGSGQRSTKKQGWTTREWTRRHEETGVDNAGVDNAGVAKHEQRGGMSRNHTEERQQLNAPVTQRQLKKQALSYTLNSQYFSCMLQYGHGTGV